MPVTIAVRFPHGHYHATSWDSAPNSGDVEWPPSPWRLARALLAVWYTRMPDLPEDAVDAVVDVLREPPRYWLPPVTSEHTRHYMPQTADLRGEKRDTTMTLDASVHVDPRAEVLIHWDADIDDGTREALDRLVRALPYLGRAESVCDARVATDADVDDDRFDDAGWCVPDPAGAHRVLCLTEETTQEELERLPDEMRAAKMLRPRGSRWVAYTSPVRSPDVRRLPDTTPVPSHGGPVVEALRWRLHGPTPFRPEFGLWGAEALRAGRLKAAEDAGVVEAVLTGHLPRDGGRVGRPTQFRRHESAHWFWLEGTGSECFSWSSQAGEGIDVDVPRHRVVQDLAVWIPGGVPESWLLPLVRGYQGQTGLFRSRGYQPTGYVPADLHLVAMGSVADVLPEIVGRDTTEWVSATPYLTTRHRHREAMAEFVADDIRREWDRRAFLDGHALVDVEIVDSSYPQRWASRYRRNRWLLSGSARASRGMAEPAYQTMARLRVEPGLTGPVSLGALSHFGFGLFVPMGRHG